MVKGAIVIAKCVHVGTLFHLDACTIQCNSLISITKRPIEELSLEIKPHRR